MLTGFQDPDHTLNCSFRIAVGLNKPNLEVLYVGTLEYVQVRREYVQVKERDSF